MSKHKIKVGSVECGSDTLFIISGPCVIEDESTMMQTAQTIKQFSESLGVPAIFKSSFQKDNRSSVDYYTGPGIEKGLRILEMIKQQFELPLLTDIHYPSQVAPVADVVDVLQIPAYLVMQTDLVLSAAKTGKTINLKHGQFLDPENMDKPVKKVEHTGNTNILLTERGYTFGYNDLIVDPRSFYHLRKLNYPVIFDVTHSIRKYGIPSADPRGGMRRYLKTLAFSSVAAGVDGLFIETHPNPEQALCDAASQLHLSQLEDFVKPLIELHALEVKHR